LKGLNTGMSMPGNMLVGLAYESSETNQLVHLIFRASFRVVKWPSNRNKNILMIPVISTCNVSSSQCIFVFSHIACTYFVCFR
jgi:hypothetical protein